MAATYDLSRSVTAPDGLVTSTPYWVLGVVRFADPVTYDPSKRNQNGGVVSFSTSDDDAVRERPPLVLTDDVVQYRTSVMKEAHVTNLMVSLAPSRNWLVDILPGDWVVFCALNSEVRGRQVAEKMRRGEAINGWDDGLKFIGRAMAPRLNKRRDPDGKRTTRYSLNCVGFSEFDSHLLYHPQLQQNVPALSLFHQFGVAIKEVVNRSGSAFVRGLVDINLIVPKLIRTVFTVGAWKQTPQVPTLAVQASPNAAYLVPPTISKWMGLPGAKTFGDLLGIMVGLHHYQTVANASDQTRADPWALFQPDGFKQDEYGVRRGRDLNGFFGLQVPPLDTSVWDMLSAYSNAPVNEMYVTLRADPQGRVLPHFILRQTPYSTKGLLARLRDLDNDNGEALPEYVRLGKPGDYDATDFLEVPRWSLPDSLVEDVDIGRSDAARVNMVHVTGSGPSSNAQSSAIDSFVRAPPNIDILDIKRNGLRPYTPTINCTARDLALGPKAWREIMTDISMGQHLMLSGQFVSKVGIQEPITVGDNLLYEGLVFHIEGLSHIGAIQPDGTRQNQTVVAVSHGIESAERRQRLSTQGANAERRNLYAGASETEQDVGTDQAGISVERK